MDMKLIFSLIAMACMFYIAIYGLFEYDRLKKELRYYKRLVAAYRSITEWSKLEIKIPRQRQGGFGWLIKASRINQ